MAFSFTKDNETVVGDMRMSSGTFTSGGTTGGAIYTGLQKVYSMQLQHVATGVVADNPSLVTTLPAVDPVTIKTTSSKNGMWVAWGV